MIEYASGHYTDLYGDPERSRGLQLKKTTANWKKLQKNTKDNRNRKKHNTKGKQSQKKTEEFVGKRKCSEQWQKWGANSEQLIANMYEHDYMNHVIVPHSSNEPSAACFIM